MALRVLILGNSGAGKSTLAKRLEAELGLVRLDLDSVVWVPNEVAKARPPADIERDLQAFAQTHSRFVVEGCYGEWIAYLGTFATHLVFLNPGLEACLANNRNRPHEPHKYQSLAEQNAMFEALQQWVKSYATRDDAWSLAGHRRAFADFKGDKREVSDGQIDPILTWLASA